MLARRAVGKPANGRAGLSREKRGRGRSGNWRREGMWDLGRTGGGGGGKESYKWVARTGEGV